MSNFSAALRNEILRVTRKELKTELATLRKTVSTQRSDIAALKRDTKTLTSQLKALQKVVQRSSSDAATPARETTPQEAPRRTNSQAFDGNALAAKRKQLGITQEAMATLLQASALSVYKWESSQVQPRAKQLARIQEVLKLGKRAALAQLQG